jgi:hypothetical protein
MQREKVYIVIHTFNTDQYLGWLVCLKAYYYQVLQNFLRFPDSSRKIIAISLGSVV